MSFHCLFNGMAENSRGRLFIGTAGFSSPHWFGKFYPFCSRKGDEQLSVYQETFYTVEVNSSFYGVPSADTLASWRRVTSPGFQMAFKVPKSVTHDNVSLSSDEALSNLEKFLDRIEVLGSNLGPLLFQCPRSLFANAPMLAHLAAELNKRPRMPRVAFEFRHSSWFSDRQVLDIFRKNNWALALHPNSVGRATSKQVEEQNETYALEALPDLVTANFVYVRLHGNNDTHTYRYTDEELKLYVQQLHEWRSQGLDVYCFMLNDDADAAMPQNARRLLELVHAAAAEVVPWGPKMAQQRSLHQFFTKTIQRSSLASSADEASSEQDAKRRRANHICEETLLVARGFSLSDEC